MKAFETRAKFRRRSPGSPAKLTSCSLLRQPGRALDQHVRDRRGARAAFTASSALESSPRSTDRDVPKVLSGYLVLDAFGTACKFRVEGSIRSATGRQRLLWRISNADISTRNGMNPRPSTGRCARHEPPRLNDTPEVVTTTASDMPQARCSSTHQSCSSDSEAAAWSERLIPCGLPSDPAAEAGVDKYHSGTRRA